MAIKAETLKLLIRAELMRVQDARVVEHARSILIEPYAINRQWDYGEPGQEYLCWMVLRDPVTGAEIGYCEEGFGPKHPWGLVSSGENQSMGDDSGWFGTFMDAFFDSQACGVLPIWRVFKVEPDGTEIPLSTEGDSDSTWRALSQLQEDNPRLRFTCGHSILYGERAVSC